MNNQQTVSRGPLYGTVPAQFAQLDISADIFGDEFEWDESETQYDDSNVLAFLREAATE